MTPAFLAAQIEEALQEGISDARAALLVKQLGVSLSAVQSAAEADPANGKYTTWIVKLLKAKKIRLPEDAGKIRETLEQFQQLSRKPQFQGEKDLNRYASYADLVRTLEANIEVKTKGEQVRAAQTAGTELLNQAGDLALYQVTTSQAAAKLFRHTKWCVRVPAVFEKYVDAGGTFYYLEKAGDPFKLLYFPAADRHKRVNALVRQRIRDGWDEENAYEDVDEAIPPPQCMDVYDEPTGLDEFQAAGVDVSAAWKDWDFRDSYVSSQIEKIHEGEESIEDVRRRLKVVEPYILKMGTTQEIVHYAESVLQRRWPEGERAMQRFFAKETRKKQPNAHQIWFMELYAIRFLKKQWPFDITSYLGQWCDKAYERLPKA